MTTERLPIHPVALLWVPGRTLDDVARVVGSAATLFRDGGGVAIGHGPLVYPALSFTKLELIHALVRGARVIHGYEVPFPDLRDHPALWETLTRFAERYACRVYSDGVLYTASAWIADRAAQIIERVRAKVAPSTQHAARA